jgi:hypothetical protein
LVYTILSLIEWFSLMLPDSTILHMGALGDLCLALNFAQRSGWLSEHSEVSVLATQRLGTVEYAGKLAKVRHFDSVQGHQLFTDQDDLDPRLASFITGCRVLSFLGPDRAADIERLHPAELISIDPVADDRQSKHILEQWLAQTALQSAARDWLPVADLGTETAQRTSGRPILIHPGSGGSRKCWDLKLWEQVSAELSTRHAASLVLGPVELECWAEQQRQSLAQAAPIITPDLGELATLLRSVDLLISNDSGPGHMAALFGTSTLTLFGPTRASVWRPIGEHAYTLSGRPDFGPGWGLTPQQVCYAVDEVLTTIKT